MRDIPAATKLALVEKHLLPMAAGDATKLLEKAVTAVKRQHSVPECTLLTGDEHVARVAQVALDKIAAQEAVEERKKDRVAKREVREADQAAATAARLLRRAAAAAAKISGVKRKRGASAAPRNVQPRKDTIAPVTLAGGKGKGGRAVVRAPGKRAVVASLKTR